MWITKHLFDNLSNSSLEVIVPVHPANFMFAFAYGHDTQGAMQRKLVPLWFHWIWKSLDLDHSDPKHTVKTIPTDTHTPSHSALLDLLFSIPSSDFHCNSMIPIIPPPQGSAPWNGMKGHVATKSIRNARTTSYGHAGLRMPYFQMATAY